MVIRSRNRQRVVIIHSGYKRTNHKVMPFEGLVYWRWLMNPTRNWLEILNIKFERIEITIPSNNIKRMCCIYEISNLIFLFTFMTKSPFLSIGSTWTGASISLSQKGECSAAVRIHFCTSSEYK